MKIALNFLKKIKKNNNTEWMHAHKDEYMSAKKEFESLVQELITRLGVWDEKLPSLEPKNCMFRFNRDTRFSDNKDPYKENFGAYFAYGGKKGNLPGYYFHLSPKEIFVAGGIWMPEAQDLKTIRRYILENGDELAKIIGSKNFKKNFGKLNNDYVLSRPPKGFDANHPHVELLKYKSFTVSMPLTLADATSPGLGKKIDQAFKQMKDFNMFLYKAIKSGEQSNF